MQFDNQKTRNVADIAAKILAGETVSEELKGNQHKIDANKNNKIDAHDFKMLRAKKKVEEETELTESHFKVGDEVICKASGMEGEVVKLDEPQTGKYYTVKREDGKMVKYAPDELKKEEEDEDEDEDEKEEMKEASKEQETKFHKELDTLVHKTFGKRKEEMKESVQLNESMFPGTKEYQKKYGETPQQKLKKVGDKEKTSSGEMEKTAKGVKHTRRFSEMIETYKQQGLKSVLEMLVKEEPDNEQYTAELDAQKKKASEKKTPEDEARVAKGKVDAVKEMDEEVLDADNINGVQIDTIEERSLTEPEMKKKEEVVKSMKKGMAGFKARYGDRAKEVMYATATKIAKKD